jgi:hypothetical protein
MTRILNTSIESGEFQAEKEALVTPILKKGDAEKTIEDQKAAW